MKGSSSSSSSVSYASESARARHWLLGLLYATYGCFYLSRKADSVAKIALHEEEGFTVEELAMLDTVYLVVYTLSLAASGMLSGRVPSGKLLGSALVCLAFTSFLKSKAKTPFGFAVCQVLHAVFQSAGWPTCIRLIGIWVTENRGFVMGIWTTCQSLGGILGALWATYFMANFGWPYAYLYHVPIMLMLAVICMLYVQDEPPGLSSSSYSSLPTQKNNDNNNNNHITVWKVVMIPGVVSIGIAYFFLKFLRYALLMWLPYYYEEGLHFDQLTAGYMSSSFEMGGLIGTPLIGWYSDRILRGKRDLTAAWFLSGAGTMLMLCVMIEDFGVAFNAFSMFLVGILVIGPDSILSGTVAQDLGASSAMGSQAIGTLAGLINSVGSCGSIFQSYATAFISRVYGWDVLFTIFVLCAFLSAAILFNVAHRNPEPPGAWTKLTSKRTSLKVFATTTASCFLFIFYILNPFNP